MQQKVKVLPNARQTYNVHNQGTVFSWDLVAPRGKVLQELRLDARVNLTGTLTAARFHKIIKTIKVLSEVGVVMEVQQDAIPATVIASHGFKEDNYFEVSPSNTDIVRNPSVSAAATNYDFSARFHAPLPGTRFTVTVDIDAISTAIAGATAATSDWAVSAVWCDPQDGMSQYMILGERVTNFTTKKYKNVTKVALFNATEWSSVISAVTLGKGLTQSQIGINEDQANDDLRGLATNGTSTSTRTLPILDPGTNADVFVLMETMDKPGEVSVQTTSAQAMSAVILTQAGSLDLVKSQEQV